MKEIARRNLPLVVVEENVEIISMGMVFGLYEEGM